MDANFPQLHLLKSVLFLLNCHCSFVTDPLTVYVWAALLLQIRASILLPMLHFWLTLAFLGIHIFDKQILQFSMIVFSVDSWDELYSQKMTRTSKDNINIK